MVYYHPNVFFLPEAEIMTNPSEKNPDDCRQKQAAWCMAQATATHGGIDRSFSAAG
jgi:hypothetical protein